MWAAEIINTTYLPTVNLLLTDFILPLTKADYPHASQTIRLLLILLNLQVLYRFFTHTQNTITDLI